MPKVAPSILSADFVNLERDIRHMAASGADYIHVDVMDGNFVPNITIGIPVVAAIRKITDLPLDVHLMIDRPLRYVERFCDAGADILTIHAEADTEEDNQEALRRIRERGVRAGVSIKPGTDLPALDPYMDLMDLILVMTVEPGFGGQSFMEGVLPKIQKLRETGYEGDIEVDGGVNPETIKLAARAGANVFVAGSAVFKSENPEETINILRNNAINEAK